MASRRAARRRAVEILYESDVRGTSPSDVIGASQAAGEELDLFTLSLVHGVESNLGQIDATLASNAKGWTVERMASVDRAILRVACYELLHVEDVPVSVAVSEAVEAANELSTEDSGRFVNGVLGPIARSAEACGIARADG
jgi:N utilization substance protein B